MPTEVSHELATLEQLCVSRASRYLTWAQLMDKVLCQLALISQLLSKALKVMLGEEVLRCLLRKKEAFFLPAASALTGPNLVTKLQLEN